MDGRVPPTVSTAVRRLREGKDAAGAGVGGEFFSLYRRKNMPTVVDPRFIFLAGGDLLVDP